MATTDSAKTMAEVAYERIRSRIVRLDLAPGDVLREETLQEDLDIGRTPIREALQRLAREHFVSIIPRRGMFVSGIDVSELSLLFETRTVLEPYAARLAAARGTNEHWEQMQNALDGAHQRGAERADNDQLMVVDHRCHELMWDAAGNRFLLDTLDVLYAQSDRLWHLYLSDVADMSDAVEEHRIVLDRLRAGDGERVAQLMDEHVRAFDEQIRQAVTARLAAPLT